MDVALTTPDAYLDCLGLSPRCSPPVDYRGDDGESDAPEWTLSSSGYQLRLRWRLQLESKVTAGRVRHHCVDAARPAPARIPGSAKQSPGADSKEPASCNSFFRHCVPPRGSQLIKCGASKSLGGVLGDNDPAQGILDPWSESNGTR